jgi:hypothetical protein
MSTQIDSKTSHKLLSIRPANRLTCVWLSGSDPRSPLTCVWRHPRTQKLTSLSSPTEERAQINAQGGQRCA